MSGDYPADLYAALHTGTEGDERFYRAVCAGAKRVLELGCGSGRILSAIADHAVEVHGVDASTDALRLARDRVPASVVLHEGEMQNFEPQGVFDRILIPFNGIYCLPDLESVTRTFVQVEKALAPEGLLVFDGYAGDPIHADESFEEGFDEEAAISEVHARGKRWRVFERSEYRRSDQCFTVHYRYLSEDGEEEIRAAIRHRYLRLQEAVQALERASLELVVAHGDFDQRAYDSESERMIITARKARFGERGPGSRR
jgi:SAM-dependent methyltransferase